MKIKEELKRIIKTTWRHFAVAFVFNTIVLCIASCITEIYLSGFQQGLLTAVIWFLINMFFEQIQVNNGGNNTRKQQFEDSISAGLGAFTSAIIINLF